MKILLANPPTEDNKLFIREGRCNQEQGAWTTLWPPVTLATAGAVLEVQGHDVDISDCPAQGISHDAFLEKIRSSRYDAVAWATATPSIRSDLKLSEKIKAFAPSIKTAVFGTHVTALAEECLKTAPAIDYIIRNEPEETLAELMTALAGKTDPREVCGISFRNSSGEICHNPDRPYMADLDTLPFPAWHLLDLERYKFPLKNKPFTIISPTRGCPYPCIFCTAQTYYGQKLRKKSISKIIEEIKYIIERFNITHFLFWADTFTADREYVMEFCQSVLEENLNIVWACNSRVDTVDFDLLKKMADSGCWMISYGIESGDQDVLDRVKKKITVDQSKHAVLWAKQSGILVTGHFILGLPGDSEASLKKTITFSASLDLDFVQFYSASPFPGSLLYEMACENKWLAGSAFEEFRQDNAVMNLPGLSCETINAYRKKAYRRFYLRPGQIYRVLKMMGHGNVKNAIKDGISFIKWSLT